MGREGIGPGVLQTSDQIVVYQADEVGGTVEDIRVALLDQTPTCACSGPSRCERQVAALRGTVTWMLLPPAAEMPSQVVL